MRRTRRGIRAVFRTATIMWLWQHRHHIPGAFLFLRGVPTRWRTGHRKDVLTEARLRMRLATDPRTRDVDALTHVRDGVAVLRAGVASAAFAADVARAT